MSIKSKKSEKSESDVAELKTASAEVEKIQPNNTEIKVRINSDTKELSVNSFFTKIVSKKRLVFNAQGNKVPLGTRYVMIVNPRERKIIFNVEEIDELLGMIESSLATKNFSFVCLDESTIDITYKMKNQLKLDMNELDFIVLALTELKNIISKIDAQG